MTELVVGIQHRRDDITPQTGLGAPMSIVGAIGTAPNADPTLFPLNTNVLVKTSDSTLRAALGSTGTLPAALDLLSAQLNGTTTAANVVVRRVSPGVDDFATIANIVGSESLRTGVWGFLDAGDQLGYEPRLLMAPGFTSQSKKGVRRVNITNGGSGYTSAPTVAFSGGGGGTGAAATAVIQGGVVVAVNVTSAGEGYTSAPTIAFTGGGGTGAAATAVVGANANGAVAALATVAGRLSGFIQPTGPVSSEADYLDWMEGLPQVANILHPVQQQAKVLDSQGNEIAVDMAPAIIGQYIAADAETGGVPARSPSNRQLLGIVGVTPSIPLSYIDASSKGQDYLRNGSGIVAKGQIGVIGAAARTGFVFWGYTTLSPTSDYFFANVARMRTYIELTNVSLQAPLLGRNNITTQTAQAVANTLNDLLSKMKVEQWILDFRISFDPDQNAPSDLKLGRLDVTFNAEEAPTYVRATFRSRRYEAALTRLAQQISISLGGTTTA